ncbi:MAG: hypothetical protein IKY76_00180 [Alistipes sp.]|nr:hypothetical protein [Alistipes sp.]
MKKLYSFLFAALAVVAMAQVFVACESDREEPAPQIERRSLISNKNFGGIQSTPPRNRIRVAEGTQLVGLQFLG